MNQSVHDESVDARLKRTNFIMWVNTIANVIGSLALIGIALFK
jgi:hypothetical protein